MSDKQIIATLNRLIKQLDEHDRLGEIEDTNQGFYSDLGFNSLSLVELCFLCEEEYNITIDDDDVNDFRQVKDLVNTIKNSLDND